MTAENLAIKADAGKWQRLSPFAIVYYIVRFITAFIKQGVQSLAPLAAVIFTAGENRWFIIGLIAIGAVVVLLVGAFLSYLKFRFRISDNTFLIQRGVFKRKRLSLTFDRIQNVAFKEPIYFRPFGLVVMTIESAGSSSEEVGLGGIPRALAEEIRATVLSLKSLNTASSSQAEILQNPSSISDNTPVADAETIIRQPISELVRYGLSNNNMFVFAGIIAGSLAQVNFDEYEFADVIKESITSFIGTSGFAIAAFAVSLVFAILIILMAASVLGSIISNYKYHLTRHDGRFHRTKGLFERQETSLLETKIQCLQINQPWPAKLMQRFHMVPKQVGFGKLGQDSGVQAGSGSAKFLIPSVTEKFTKYFSDILYPTFNWANVEFKPIDKIYTIKMLLWIFTPIAVMPAVSMSITLTPYALFILALPIVVSPLVMLRRSKFGYATDGEYGVIRSGFIGHKLTLFPFYKVQTVQVTQSPGQRKRGLANLTVKLAGTTLEIPFIPINDAEEWRNLILYKIENGNKPWM